LLAEIPTRAPGKSSRVLTGSGVTIWASPIQTQTALAERTIIRQLW